MTVRPAGAAHARRQGDPPAHRGNRHSPAARRSSSRSTALLLISRTRPSSSADNATYSPPLDS